MKITVRFAVHLAKRYREGLVAELEEIGASVNQIDATTYEANVRREGKKAGILSLLESEQKSGCLNILKDDA